MASDFGMFPSRTGTARGADAMHIPIYVTNTLAIPDMRHIPGGTLRPAAADPFWQNVSLLIRGEGGHHSSAIVDSSPRQKTITTTDGSVISTVNKKFGTASIRGGGSTNRNCSFTASVGTADGLMTGDFTFEFWLLSTDSGNNVGVYNNNNATLWYNGSYQLLAGGTNVPSVTFGAAQGLWRHWAVTRQNGNMRTWFDGIPNPVSIYYSGSVDFTNLQFGCNVPGGNLYQNANYDEIRLTKDVCRYTSAFLPSDLPFPGQTVLGTDYWVSRRYQSTSASNSSATATLVLSVSALASLEVGDIFIAGISSSGGVTAPAGWVNLGTQTQTAGVFDVFYKLWTGLEGTSLTFTSIAVTSTLSGVLEVIRAADPTTFAATFSIAGDNTANNTITAPTQANVVANSLIVSLGTEWKNGTTGLTCTTTGAGWTEVTDVSSSAVANVRASSSSENNTGTGTVTGGIFTWNLSGDGHAAASITFTPRTTAYK